MAAKKASSKKLAEQVSELYQLADMLECDVRTPEFKLMEMYEDSMDKLAPAVSNWGKAMVARGNAKQAFLIAGILGAVWLGAGAIDLGRHAVSSTRAKLELNAIYKEIAVKTQAVTQQLSEDNKKLLELLLEEREKNVDNQTKIEELKAKIDRGNEILHRFEALGV